MENKRNNIVFFLMLFLLTACVSNTFENNFIESSSGVSKAVTILTEVQEPNLIESDDVEADLNKILQQNYKVLGINEFEDVMKSKRLVIEFAKKINASNILFSRTYVETRYKRPKEAARRETVAISMLERKPLGTSNYKKFEREKIYKYSVIYLTR